MRPQHSARQWIGSVLFTLYLFASVPCYALAVVAVAPRGPRAVYRIGKHWASTTLRRLRALCRLDYRVRGAEHLGGDACVVLMKHSSAWETLAQVEIFPRQTWVMKRELMWAPVFGWVLPLFKPIAINRKGGREAVQQVVAQGRERLREGLWGVIFPEGTRVPRGETRRYGISGALLAIAAGRPVIPVAHNAGDYWPRRGWLKRPGTIEVVIGEPIDTLRADARVVTAQARAWIDQTLEEIASRARPG
jgi:1-acyl-sn-glycerol-3-phosphate acyltransferase